MLGVPRSRAGTHWVEDLPGTSCLHLRLLGLLEGRYSHL